MNLSEQRLVPQMCVTAGHWIPYLLLLLLAAGCARFAPSQLSSQSGAANFHPNALADPGLRRFMEQQLQEPIEKWPLHEWDFSRLTLAACYFHPRFETARRQWQRAEAELAAARDGFKLVRPDSNSFSEARLPVPFAIITPEAGAAPSGAELFSLPSANRKSLAGHPDQRARRIDKAQYLAGAARFRLRTVAWQVQANLRTNLVAYVAARRGAALLEELEAVFVKLIHSGELRGTTGSMSRLELSLLQFQLAQTRLVLILTRLEMIDSRARLAEALALPVNALFDVEVNYDFSRGADRKWSAQELRQQALLRRPDLMNALIDYAAAEALVRAEIAAKRPRLQLPAGWRWDSQRNRWAVSLDLRLPADKRDGRAVARSESRRIAAAARLLNLQADIIDELERSAAVYGVMAGEVSGIETLVTAILRQYAALKEQFEAGLADSSEFLLARLQLVAAEVAKLEAQAKLQNALGALEDALQQPAELIGHASPF